MAKLEWSQIQRELKQQASGPESPPADEFWTDFRSRLSAESREDVVSAPFLWFAPKTAWAMAAAFAFMLGLTALLLPTAPSSSSNTVASAAVNQQVSEVEEIDVFVTYSSVMIMQDEQNGSTLVWVGDMESGGDDG